MYQLLTYNATQPVHVRRTPVLSFALLTQVSRIGRVAVWFQDVYTRMRWDGEEAQLRRGLTPQEAYALRRAIYRIWLYSEAFHTPAAPRTLRMNPALVAERCQLLRTWSTDGLLEIEDVRVSLKPFWRPSSALPMERFSGGGAEKDGVSTSTTRPQDVVAQQCLVSTVSSTTPATRCFRNVPSSYRRRSYGSSQWMDGETMLSSTMP